MEMYYTIRVVVSNFLDGDVFVNEETIFQTFCRIQINSFMVTDPNGVDVGLALYPRAARLDHSCIPELQYLFSNREIILYGYDSSIHSTAPRINYYECMTTTEERQAYLLKNYYFKCNCGLCTDSDREKRITALICCSSDYLNGPIIFDKLPSFVKLKVCNDDKFARPIMVRYCPTCLKVYDDSLINQIAGHLYGETKVHVDIDTALDALIMYSRCCPISKPIQNIQLTTVKDIQLEESRSYYKLFGHKDSLHVARCCSRVQFLHTISIDSLFDIVNKRHQYNVKRLEISKDTLVNVIIAISLNEYYWRTTWLLSDRLQLGQLAYSVASFLLYHISDIDEFRNSNRMNEIKNHLTFVYNTYNNFDCLGHVLCKFSSIAYDILSPLTEYRFNWQQGLNTLVYYKAQDIEGSNIINDIRELV
ncbi:Histone-lysine N-methyltransferase SMYD3 [Schistosoma japonicum]|nr:Histone-lysine N-methyltransferase SMYD3 [Schistosoma japonicum]